MNRRHLVLIRHSQSQPDPSVSSDQWGLSEKGRTLCKRLIPHLVEFRCEQVFSSPEPKALQTAQYVADHYDVHINVQEGLCEHDRRNEPWLDSQTEFEARVKEMFHQPARLVFGSETADQAVSRFSGAIEGIVDDSLDLDVVAATHGTVMSLFVCRYNPIDPIEFWARLGMPAMVVLALPWFELISMVEHI
jgi:broad specificity phosphatase PhoE